MARIKMMTPRMALAVLREETGFDYADLCGVGCTRILSDERSEALREMASPERNLSDTELSALDQAGFEWSGIPWTDYEADVLERVVGDTLARNGMRSVRVAVVPEQHSGTASARRYVVDITLSPGSCAVPRSVRAELSAETVGQAVGELLAWARQIARQVLRQVGSNCA